MIQPLKTVAPDIKEKPKFIWDISTESIDVFSRLAFRNIRIDGFVTCDSDQLGESFLNVQVIDIETLKEYSSAILIVPDECWDCVMTNHLLQGKIDAEVKCYSDILQINTELMKQPVYVLATDEVGNSVRAFMEKNGVFIEAFVTLDAEIQNQYEGIPVLPLSVVLSQKQQGIIVLAITDESYRNRVLNLIEKYSETDICFINELVNSVLLKQNKLFPFIDNALKQKKKVYLTAEGTAFSDKIESILQMYDIPIEGYVSAEEKESECGKSIFDLYYEGLEQVFVIVITTERSETERISNILESIGLSIDRHEYVGIYPVQFRGHHPSAFDSLLDQSIKVEKNFPGVFIIGTRRSDSTRIVVLGGSTSTCNVLKPKSWVEFFYGEIHREIGDVTIYNMAHEGEDVTQELLRLLRDGAVLQPNYVISMSGVNNTNFKNDMDNQFNTEMPKKWLKAIDPNVKVLTGIRGNDNLFQFWKRNQRVIKAVSEIYGAKYLGVLQPMDLLNPHKSFLYNTMMKNCKESVTKCFYEESTHDDFYINMLDFFWNADEDMYIDNCHYTTQANKLIAQEVAKKFLQL